MCLCVIFFFIFGKEHFQRNDMHIVISLAQLPIAVRHTVDGANVIFIFVKWGSFDSNSVNLFPKIDA